VDRWWEGWIEEATVPHYLSLTGNDADQWWIEGWATGAADQGTKGGGTKEGEQK